MSPAEKKKTDARRSIRQHKQRAGTRDPSRQPVVVKTSETSMAGIRSFEASRYVIGYVLSGYKYIYNGDLRSEISPGDVFFLSKGIHYIEEVPDARKPFEQIMFFYTPEQLGRIVAGLSVEHNTDTGVRHSCEACQTRSYVVTPGWNTLKHFFTATDLQLQDGFFAHSPTAGMLALTQLVYQIISHPESCLRTRVLSSTDPEKELLERQIRDYIFSGITLEEFAQKNNRSLTSFKKKFKNYFNDSPHRWVVRQRLMHARLGLISTNKPIAQIGVECRFPNTSHFIKLFRREFGITPAQYRRKHKSDVEHSPDGYENIGAQ